MKQSMIFIFLAFMWQTSIAAFVPQIKTNGGLNEQAQTQNLVKSLTVEEFQKVSGRKLTRFQKWQYLKLQRKLQNSKMAIIPERDELTEGFQALPFFGAILTLGISALVMFFTAQDRNAMRWAMNGVWLLAIAFSVISIISALSGY
jgi:hypothetical protein